MPASIVLSDLHLNLRGERACIDALKTLLVEYPNAELIFVGDVFEFSSLFPLVSAKQGWELLRNANPSFCAVLREHLSAGNPATFVCGNHDAPLSEIEAALQQDLCPHASQLLRVGRWSIRRGQTYLEHGHVYDPDNAPLHPLADWRADSEPIGIALMRRFVAAHNAFSFAHAHRITPAEAVRRACTQYGIKTPWIAARYFETAGRLCVEAAVQQKTQRRADRRQGRARVPGHAAAEDFSESALNQLLNLLPSPTHASARAVFLRLYFDRVAALLLAGAGGLLSLRRPGLAPLALFIGASGFLAASISRGAQRSSDPVSALQQAAHQLRSLLGVELVVFGHTHVAVDSAHYVNLGSFEYSDPKARPWLLLDSAGRATRRYAKTS